MSDPDSTQADQDKIRARRLARLGGASQSNTNTGSSSNTASSTSATPAIASPKASAETANPFAQIVNKPQTPPAPKININSRPSVPQKRDGEQEGVVPKPRPSQQEVSPEMWEDRTLSNIFRVSVDPNKKHDPSGHPLQYLPDLRTEMESSGAATLLTTSDNMLEQAVLEAATVTRRAPIEYLLECWKRVSRMSRDVRRSDNKIRIGIIQEARRICMSYCLFAVNMPEMFSRDAAHVNVLAQHLLCDPESDRGICTDFLSEAVSRLGGDEDEDVKTALIGALKQLSQELSKLNMNGGYKPYVQALRSVCRYPALVTAITETDNFLPSGVRAQDIETKTFLGPFFALSPLQSDVALNYFGGSASGPTADRRKIEQAQSSLRVVLQNHQDELLEITNAFIKTKTSRDRMLDWLAHAVNANHKRRAIRVDKKTVSSDGFMVNVTVVCDRLCEPFMDSQFGKIDRIDPDYLRRNPRVDIKDETKINADQEKSDEFYAQPAEGSNNFISEIFFLTAAAHHYGTEATASKLDNLLRDVKWMEKQLEKLELERHKFTNSPQQLALFENHVNKFKDEVARARSSIHAVQGVLLDDLTQQRSMQFMRYVIAWVLRLAVPGLDFPRQELPLPLSEEQPMAFACLPEYFLEGIVDNFKFITRYMPHIITQLQCKELMVICIAFLRTTEYIKNPYLKAGLVTILYHGVHPLPRRSKGILGDLLSGDNFAMKHLLHALMKFYIEVERTGAHNQFYDKFNIRYEIFQIIKCVWSNQVYKDNLATEARVNLDFFVRFVNLLLNDVTYVLDESFTAFHSIHDLQKELRAPENLSETERTEKEEALSAAQSRAKNYMSLTNETVAMLILFTDALAVSFTKPEIVQRLADMLDYNLDALVGPRQANLKVDNPAEFGWDPKNMLSQIMHVFLNLQGQENFIVAVARDGRSYKPENFVSAARLVQRYALLSPDQINQWETLGVTIKAAKEADEEAEQDYSDAPDEFLDPLLATLMEDPVTLPRSRQVVDMSTIRSQLLSDPTDPFNRTPLKIEDVIPNPELQARIQAWKEEKRAARLKGQGVGVEGEAKAEEGEPMDVE